MEPARSFSDPRAAISAACAWAARVSSGERRSGGAPTRCRSALRSWRISIRGSPAAPEWSANAEARSRKNGRDLISFRLRCPDLARRTAIRARTPQRPRPPRRGASLDPRRRLGDLVHGILLPDPPLLPATPHPESLRGVRGGPRDAHRRGGGDDRHRRAPLRLDERPAGAASGDGGVDRGLLAGQRGLRLRSGFRLAPRRPGAGGPRRRRLLGGGAGDAGRDDSAGPAWTVRSDRPDRSSGRAGARHHRRLLRVPRPGMADGLPPLRGAGPDAARLEPPPGVGPLAGAPAAAVRGRGLPRPDADPGTARGRGPGGDFYESVPPDPPQHVGLLVRRLLAAALSPERAGAVHLRLGVVDADLRRRLAPRVSLLRPGLGHDRPPPRLRALFDDHGSGAGDGDPALGPCRGKAGRGARLHARRRGGDGDLVLL